MDNIKRNSDIGYVTEKTNIKAQVFHELSKNPLLTAKPLCAILHLSFKVYGQYIRNLRSQWKRNIKNGLGSKCPNFHNWHGWAYVPVVVDRSHALQRGWVQSGSRNRAFLFRDRLGRLEWFETGRFNIHVRKPANPGKLAQLLAHGFSWTGLIPDPRVLKVFIDSVRYKGAHLTYDTGERLPYAKIDFLKDSLGVVVKTGDLSHPTCIEIEFHMPKWAEEALEDRRAFIEIMKRAPDPGEAKPENNIGVV
jgi:hypothetical protein